MNDFQGSGKNEECTYSSINLIVFFVEYLDNYIFPLLTLKCYKGQKMWFMNDFCKILEMKNSNIHLKINFWLITLVIGPYPCNNPE